MTWINLYQLCLLKVYDLSHVLHRLSQLFMRFIEYYMVEQLRMTNSPPLKKMTRYTDFWKFIKE